MLSCQRLSLTPLSYLWQRDQAELLSEMIAAGMQAVLIKVAGIGLTTKHLGKTLSEMQHTLVTLVGSALISLLMMVRTTVIEYVVWFAYLRGGGRIRDIDTRLSALQAAHHVVSYFFANLSTMLIVPQT